jgi:hypothetical protein
MDKPTVVSTPVETEQNSAVHEVLLRSDSITPEMRREFAELWRSFPNPRRVPENDTLRRDRPESEGPV